MAPFRNNTQGPINHPLSDLLTQTILLTTRNGTEIPISLQDLSNIQYLAITWSACFAIQIGAATILFCLLPLLSNPSRRRSLPFLCNMITLAIVILRGILHIYYYFSPFTTPYRLFTEEYIGIPMSARIISIASAITTLLLKAMVQFSLIIQLRILFQNREGIKNALTIGTSLLAAVSTGIYVWIVVLSTEVILQEPVGHSSPNSRLTFASKVTFAGSITVFSALLVGKLLVAIKERRALGLKKFGVFKIALVLGLQTMFIPGKFPSSGASIAQYGGYLRKNLANIPPSNFHHRRQFRRFRRSHFLHSRVSRNVPTTSIHVGISKTRFSGYQVCGWVG